MARLDSDGDFWHATMSEKLVNLWQPDIYSRLWLLLPSAMDMGQMTAWRVLVGLGNGIMTSMKPVLYFDVVYQGPELGGILASKIPGTLTLWRTETSSMGMLEYPSPDQQRIEAYFLSAHV